MIEKLEITHLRTLDALYKFGNISAAAEYLGVSQQATSLQLKKIRSMLGDRLFVSTGHGVAPTHYAKHLEAHVQSVLAALNKIPLPDNISLHDIERTLVISATDYTQEMVVAHLVKEMRTHAPRVKVIVGQIESARLTQKMDQGQIDIAFTTSGYVPNGLLSHSLFTEHYRCVSANQHLRQDNELPLSELVKHDFVITSPGVGGLTGSADSWFEQQGCSRRVAVSVPSFFMAREYLKRTNMVGFIPSRLLPCAGLYDIPLEKYPPGYEVVAAYHPSAKNDPWLRWLLDVLLDTYS